MFKKLRIRITFSTLLILIILLATLTTAIYQFAKIEFNKSIDIMLKESAYSVILTGDINKDFYATTPFDNRFDLSKEIKNKIKVNYFVYNQNMKTEIIKSDDVGIMKELRDQAVKALKEEKEFFETIEINGINYRVYSSFFKNFNMVGVVQVYRSLEIQDILLNNLLKILIYSGVVGLIVLSAISFWLSGRYIKPVKNAWEKQKSFTADASHELRTPLTVIKTNLDAATYDKNSKIEDNKIWFDNINDEINNMNLLVSELLLLAKGDSIDLKFDMKTFNLSEVLIKIIENYKNRIEEKQIKIHHNIMENVYIYGNENKIRQLITIILDNSIKYNKDYGDIFISLNKIKKQTILEIKDTGIGIDREEVDKVFDRFYRGSKERNREEGGTGLGLSIAKRIIDKHKGKIELSSEIGKGTTVKIFFKK